MSWCLFKRFILGVLCTLYLPGVAFSAPSDSSWGIWFNNQINLHPEIVAARENMNAALSAAEGLERPLYNPELETEFEHEGDANNYLVGISQTIDWRDKRSISTQQASSSRIVAQQSFVLTVQQKIADALQALVEWQSANKQSTLALQQEVQLDTLLTLIKGRLHAGDLGQVDAELAFLSLSQTLNATAQAQAQLKQAESNLHERLPDWSVNQVQIPEKIWLSTQPSAISNQWLEKHPAIILAKSEWSTLQQSAELAHLDTKADPTFGINAGETDDENILSLSFSIPLNVRNNFSAEARSAKQEALSAEAQFHAIRRQQALAIESSQAIFQIYQQRVERWQSLMQGRGELIENLLEKQWRSGDLSTSEYLLSLKQRTEGLLAGIELNTQFQLARINWLLQTGQINVALMQLTQ